MTDTAWDNIISLYLMNHELCEMLQRLQIQDNIEKEYMSEDDAYLRSIGLGDMIPHYKNHVSFAMNNLSMVSKMIRIHCGRTAIKNCSWRITTSKFALKSVMDFHMDHFSGMDTMSVHHGQSLINGYTRIAEFMKTYNQIKIKNIIWNTTAVFGPAISHILPDIESITLLQIFQYPIFHMPPKMKKIRAPLHEITLDPFHNEKMFQCSPFSCSIPFTLTSNINHLIADSISTSDLLSLTSIQYLEIGTLVVNIDIRGHPDFWYKLKSLQKYIAHRIFINDDVSFPFHIQKVKHISVGDCAIDLYNVIVGLINSTIEPDLMVEE